MLGKLGMLGKRQSQINLISSRVSLLASAVPVFSINPHCKDRSRFITSELAPVTKKTSGFANTFISTSYSGNRYTTE